MRASVADAFARIAAAQRERQDAGQDNEKWVRAHRLLRIKELAQPLRRLSWPPSGV
jgi:hypothetical protein